MKKEVNNIKNVIYITREGEKENNNKYYEIEISYNYNYNNILYKSIVINEVENKGSYKTRSFNVYEDNQTIAIEKVNRKSTKKLQDLINNYSNFQLKLDLLMFLNNNMSYEKKEFIKSIIEEIKE